MPVRLHLVDSDPRDALIAAARTAHLVVVGSRGHGPVRTLALGSVSEAVARHAECPVVVCRPPRPGRPELSEILVGADGTAASVPVIEFAFQQASLHGLPLVVVHCFSDPTLRGTGHEVLPDSEPSDVASLRMLLSESVAGLREKFPDVDVDLQLARGLVEECLLDAAPEVGLLVVGRTHVSGFCRFFHASCAMAVLERASTPVAVVPENDPQPRERHARTERNTS